MIRTATTIARLRSFGQITRVVPVFPAMIAAVVLGFPAASAAQPGHAHGEHAPPAARPADTTASAKATGKTAKAADTSAGARPATAPATADKPAAAADVAASANASMSGP